eukprot:CAMPEP_0182442074 /NCGR_PEP_ID=MMETSP1172-20130603/1051_1 /TAXON_ID=708627 /ORGANISM="Timspurckia oligopyrenoides, Strain CCMP3278" /LENGTH=266 /DNA_ID=CAMNT_0024636767 /DNA_START=83 /DNA_END=883 /DNA_ORIENTATION=+
MAYIGQFGGIVPNNSKTFFDSQPTCSYFGIQLKPKITSKSHSLSSSSTKIFARRSNSSNNRNKASHRGDGRRPNRVAELLKRELSVVLSEQYKTYFLSSKSTREIIKSSSNNTLIPSSSVGAFSTPKGTSSVLSIVDIDVSPDLRNARVNISLMGSDELRSQAVVWMNSNRQTMRYLLAQKVSYMKFVPELRFTESEAAAAFRTVSILDQLGKDRMRKTGNNEIKPFDTTKPGFNSDDELEMEISDEFEIIDDFSDSDDSESDSGN